MPPPDFEFPPLARRSDALLQVEKTAKACKGCISDAAYKELLWLKDNIANSVPEPYNTLIERLRANFVQQVESIVTSVLPDSVTSASVRRTLNEIDKEGEADSINEELPTVNLIILLL